MVGFANTLVSRYKIFLDVLNALHRSAPQDRLRTLVLEVERHWMHRGTTQV